MYQKNKKGKNLILLIILTMGFSFGLIGVAQGLLVDWPASPAGTQLTVDSTVTNLVQYLFEWGIALGGLITFIALLIAGFFYMTSVGDPTKMKNAMDRIKSAFLGLALLLSSWLILHTINPDLTKIKTPVLNIDATLNKCDAGPDDDVSPPICPEPPATKPYEPQIIYRCFGDTNPGDGNREGICARKTLPPEIIPCDRVLVFERNVPKEQKYHYIPGTAGQDGRGGHVVLTKANPNKTWEYENVGSIMFLRRARTGEIGTHDRDGTLNEGGNYKIGGACSVYLYGEGGWWLWRGCRHRLGVLTYTHYNTLHKADRKVGCLKLIRH